jgi:hypothetical protein
MLATQRTAPLPCVDVGFGEVRQRSEALCAPLETDDYQVQSVIDASPPKWHLAHVTWFFETFLLKPYLRGYEPLDPRYERIYNSYYNTVGPFHPRAQRHTLSRPTVPQVYEYRAHVDRHMSELLETCAAEHRAEFEKRLTLGMHHEQQHQELLLMDIKRNFFANPLYPVYSRAHPPRTVKRRRSRWLDFPGGIREIGLRRRLVRVRQRVPAPQGFPARLSPRLAPGHQRRVSRVRPRRRLLAPGPVALRRLGRRAGAALERAAVLGRRGRRVARDDALGLAAARPGRAGVPRELTTKPTPTRAGATPACRRGRVGVRGRGSAIEGNFVESGAYHPRAAASEADPQWYGDVWEWTSSATRPTPATGRSQARSANTTANSWRTSTCCAAACCATPRSHVRASYRNFFYRPTAGRSPASGWPATLECRLRGAARRYTRPHGPADFQARRPRRRLRDRGHVALPRRSGPARLVVAAGARREGDTHAFHARARRRSAVPSRRLRDHGVRRYAAGAPVSPRGQTFVPALRHRPRPLVRSGSKNRRSTAGVTTYIAGAAARTITARRAFSTGCSTSRKARTFTGYYRGVETALRMSRDIRRHIPDRTSIDRKA